MACDLDPQQVEQAIPVEGVVQHVRMVALPQEPPVGSGGPQKDTDLVVMESSQWTLVRHQLVSMGEEPRVSGRKSIQYRLPVVQDVDCGTTKPRAVLLGMNGLAPPHQAHGVGAHRLPLGNTVRRDLILERTKAAHVDPFALGVAPSPFGKQSDAASQFSLTNP